MKESEINIRETPMERRIEDLILRLKRENHLETGEYEELVKAFSPEVQEFARREAEEVRKENYGSSVFIRGLIEISNVCRNDCYYCGIRRSNESAERYRLTADEILESAQEGHAIGFRTFVMQGGEGDESSLGMIEEVTREMKRRWPDSAVTLSLGEYPRKVYERLFEAGADRYLLRHETADEEHYKKLHPVWMSWENRMRCLRDLHEIGYQTGCGFMVGSPYQSPKTLAKDLSFIERFSPEMCGIGPFIPQKDTPFRDMEAGTKDMTLYLLSLLRLMIPRLLLPATTALGTVAGDGRLKGILAGANVIMPNLSPKDVRKKYALYDGKAISGCEAAENLEALKESLATIDCHVEVSRGDMLGFTPRH